MTTEVRRPTPAEEDPGLKWDQVVASALARASTTASKKKPFGLVKLPLRERPPTKRVMERVARSVDQIDSALREAIRALVAGQSRWPLFLHGPVGTGKTCAALCLLDYSEGDYFTVTSLCATVIQSQQGRLEWTNEARGGTIWPEQFWRGVSRAPLIVLDELGCRERPSDAHYDAVKQCVDERMGKPFVAISNHGPAALAKLYDDRIASRLACGTVIGLRGADRRIEGLGSKETP